MSRAKRATVAPLPTDRLWSIEETMRFFGLGESWVRQHVPAVQLPGDGARRPIRFRPETCHAIARHFEIGHEAPMERAS